MTCLSKPYCKKADECGTYLEYDIKRCILFERKPLTNEEWLKSLDTEQLTEFLFSIAYMCSYCGDEAHSTKEKIQQCHFGKCGCVKKDWEMWLKQTHKEG